MKLQRRTIIKVGYFLLAGAIINVAVAWGCGLWSPDDFEAEIVNSDVWPIAPAEDWHDLPEFSFKSPVRGYTNWFAFGPGDGWRKFQAAHRYGLPMRSLMVAFETDKYLNDFAPGRTVGAWITIPSFARDPVRHQNLREYLPVTPVFPGFAINTIFYAAILYALFAVPGAVRRRLRKKRGQCAACGYSLRGRGPSGNTCPECGEIA